MKVNQSHRTAISRKNLSQPSRYLLEHGFICGRVLDFGCGLGRDCKFIGCEGYDPYYQPIWPEGRFDTILCHFVLNVLPLREERLAVVAKVHDLLSRNGNAFFSVRNDKRNLNGWTKKDTYQAMVTMRLPLLSRTSGYAIYWMGV